MSRFEDGHWLARCPLPWHLKQVMGGGATAVERGDESAVAARGAGADPTEVGGTVRLFPPLGRGWDGVVAVVERVNGARVV